MNAIAPDAQSVSVKWLQVNNKMNNLRAQASALNNALATAGMSLSFSTSYRTAGAYTTPDSAVSYLNHAQIT